MSDEILLLNSDSDARQDHDPGPPLICAPDCAPFTLTGGTAELYLRTTDGQYFLGQIETGQSVFPDAGEGKNFILIVTSKITVAALSNAQLDQGTEDWRAMVANIGSGEISLDAGSSIAQINHALGELLRQRAMRQDDAELARLQNVGTSNEQPQIFGGLPELMQACAKTLHSQFHATRLPAASSEFDDVPAVARHYGLASRFVTQNGNWYEQDQGPVILQYAETDALTCALWDKKYYVTADGLTIDAENKALFEQRSYVISAPLPEKIEGLWSLGKFVIHGNFEELKSIALAATLVGILGAITPLAAGWILSDLAPSGEAGLLLGIGAGLVMAALVSYALATVRGMATSRIEGKTSARMATAIYDRVLRLPTAFFREYTAGDLNQRLSGIDGMRQLILSISLTAGLSAVFSMFYFFVLTFYDLRLAFISVLLIAVYILIVIVTRMLQMPLLRESYALDGELAEQSYEMFGAVAKLRSAAAEDRALARWANLYGQERALERKAGFIGGYSSAVSDSWQMITQIILFAAVATLAADALAPGTFIAFLVAFGSFQGAFVGLSAQLLELYAAQPQIERAMPILQAPMELSVNRADPGTLKGDVSVSNVTFGYGESLAPVLSGISLDIPAGAHFAIVGGSGSGKSTLLRLLLGFETPRDGTIFYDNQNMAEIDATRLRSQIGVVMQSSSLFAGSIIDNIRGAHDASLEQCMEAADRAGLARDLETFPMGIHTPITEGAAVLSGGQRQRILIARSLVSRPNMLFFDEATSALDNASQAQVAETLDSMPVTRITIAHRLSTIENADQICVLENGNIAEQGSYAELMAKDGAFAALARRQLMEE